MAAEPPIGGIGRGMSRDTKEPAAAAGPTSRKNAVSPEPPQVPNSTVVLKNLPFELDLSELDRVLEEGRASLGMPLQYRDIRPLKNEQGRFTGIAFLNFYTVEDAIAVHHLFTDRVFLGRPVNVRYRHNKNQKQTQTQTQAHNSVYRPAIDDNGGVMDKRIAFFKARSAQRERDNLHGLNTFSRDNVESIAPTGADADRHQDKIELRKMFEEHISRFAAGDPIDLTKLEGGAYIGQDESEFVFPLALTGRQRGIIHQLAHEQKLGHRSFENEDGVRQIHITRDQVKIQEWKNWPSLPKESAKNSQGDTRPRVAPRKSPVPAPSTSPPNVEKLKIYVPRSQRKPKEADTGGAEPATETTSKEAGDGMPNDALLKALGDAGVTVQLPRQPPKGPDGTRGFMRRIAAHALSQSRQSGPEEGAVAVEQQDATIEPVAADQNGDTAS